MSEKNKPGTQETFITHLVELRTRVVRASILFLAIFFILFGLWPGAASLYDLLAQPMISSLPEGTKMIATGVITPFMVPVKMTMMVAFVVSLPWILYQAWAFIAPGLYKHEKNLVAPLIISSTILFLIGIAFCYFFVFGTVFNFIYNFAPDSISVAPDIENYLDFILTMCLAFGLTFEVPVLVIVLVKIDMISVEKLKSARPYVIVGAFIIAAIVTPPDVMSQLFLAIPLCLLYEVGLVLAPAFRKSSNTTEEVNN
tara:strand:+ start:1131 stop:1898 length:768 start_codon:yes stop_codon:yes gene_type:complete